MFYFASKILDPLLQPFNWFVLGWLVAVLKSRGVFHRWLLGGWIALLVFSNPWLADRVLHSWESGYPDSILPGQHDMIVALGGGCVTVRDAKGRRLQVGETFDRVFQAARLLQSGAAPKLLLSGNKDPSWIDLPSEAEASRSVLLSMGVPASAILVIDTPRNTIEEAKAIASMTRNRPRLFPHKRLILVTSATHLRRAVWCFERCGLAVTAFPADFQSNGDTPSTLLSRFWACFPSADALTTWGRLLHEWVGIGVYRLRY